MPAGPDSPVHVSAVICTRNREDQIARAVGSVLANDYPSFDLTVIDQSTSQATRDAIAELIDADPRLHYVHSDQAGLSRAYNTGVASSTGEILVFTDDDCVAGPDWIATIVAAFESDPEAELLYGEVVAFGETEEEASQTPTLVFDGPARLTRRDGFRVIGMGANYAARRSLFTRVGPFDVVLGGGGPLRSSQDFDLMYRTIQSGGVVLLRPEVTMRHDGRRESGDWPALLRAYGTGDGAFLTKHIRCRDPRALWVLSKWLGKACARWIKKRALRQPTDGGNYVAGVLTGVRESFKFRVDRATRMYVEP